MIPPIVAGLPSYLVVYLRWKDPDPALDSDEATTMKLPWSATNERWEAHAPGPGFSLGGRVTPEEADDLYECRLEFYIDGTESEQHAWHDIKMGPGLPWDSRLLMIQEPEPSEDLSMRVYA